MANKIGLITKYGLRAWDEVYKQESVTSLLDMKKDIYSFTGAKTVKIPKIQLGGLSDYYRNNTGDDRVNGSDSGFGYTPTGTNVAWEERTLRHDRQAKYQIEYFDDEEAGGAVVGHVVSESTRTVVIPEVDATCLSEIADNVYKDATIERKYNDPKTDTPLADLNEALLWFENNEVPFDDVIIYCAPKYMSALRNTTEVTKFLGQEDYRDNKDVRFKITKYEDATLVTTSPRRLRTHIVLGKEGYSWGTDSRAINFLAVAKSAVAHIVKYDTVKVISGDMNLAGNGFDGYSVYARVYHDCFVLDNKKVALFMNIEPSSEEGADKVPTMSLDVKIKDGKIKSIVTAPGDVICVVGKSSTDETIGSEATSNFTEVHVGDTASSSDVFYVATSVWDGSKFAKIIMGQTPEAAE